jgi:hypothetical protein
MIFPAKHSIFTAVVWAATCMSSAAQETAKDCFSITSPPTVAGGQSLLTIFGINAMNGSILINRCTGRTWFLARSATIKGSFAYRWFPIGTMTDEATYSEPKSP